MMFPVLIFAVSACIVSADFTCPDGKVTCADGKACCFQSGSGYSCCDKPVDTNNLISGTPSLAQPHLNQTLASFSNNYFDYCPRKFGKRICCTDLSLENCQEGSECCTDDACCLPGLRCCGSGQWCCLKKYKCGPYFNTCKNGAVSIGVQGMAVIVTVALAAMKFAKM